VLRARRREIGNPDGGIAEDKRRHGEGEHQSRIGNGRATARRAVQSAPVTTRCGSGHGEQLLHHNHARYTLQTAFHRDALIDRAFEQLIERR
jgi:hypothetical protein